MSRADYIYLKTTNRILEEGSWDTNMIVRPKWEDGTPAHAAKIFNVNNTYKLADEMPIVTLRNTNWKAAIDEIIWIWVKKSNNVNDLNSHIWDQWADESGSIGEAYGAQARKKAIYKEGMFDQIDRVIYYLKNQPAFRSMITEIFVHEDLHKMHLYPCVHGMNFDVTDGKLNLFLNQRSNDTLAAGSWNVVQYSALVYMLAQVCGLEPGMLAHEVVNAHIYDRHVPFIVHITFSRAKELQRRIENLDACQLISLVGRPEAKTKFESLQKELLKEHIEFEKLIAEAKELEKAGLVDAKAYQEYTKKIVETSQFERAKYIIDTMADNPEFEKILGYKSPRLILDKNVTDYYDFISPKTRDSQGKIVDNPESSFSVEDYSPETEGVKLEAKVPVAE